MAITGELRVVDDVPGAFAQTVVAAAPHSVALSGGETARACYAELASRPFDWSPVDVFFGDERYVPVDHPDSNEGMARRVLLDHAHPHAVHSLYRSGPIAAAADAYDALVRGVDPIGLVHLGLGPDGHTASLFPESPALDERERFVVAAGDDAHPHPRLTFTFPGIAHSLLVVVTVSGEDKRAALARIAGGDDLPGARIRARRVLWLVDASAAP